MPSLHADQDTLEYEFTLKLRITRGEVKREPSLTLLLDTKAENLRQQLERQLHTVRPAIENVVRQEGWGWE